MIDERMLVVMLHRCDHQGSNCRCERKEWVECEKEVDEKVVESKTIVNATGGLNFLSTLFKPRRSYADSLYALHPTVGS